MIPRTVARTGLNIIFAGEGNIQSAAMVFFIGTFILIPAEGGYKVCLADLSLVATSATPANGFSCASAGSMFLVAQINDTTHKLSLYQIDQAGAIVGTWANIETYTAGVVGQVPVCAVSQDDATAYYADVDTGAPRDTVHSYDLLGSAPGPDIVTRFGRVITQIEYLQNDTLLVAWDDDVTINYDLTGTPLNTYTTIGNIGICVDNGGSFFTPHFWWHDSPNFSVRLVRISDGATITSIPDTFFGGGFHSFLSISANAGIGPLP